MSKKATIIQHYNDITREFEYNVKGFDITESVKVLLKTHKEAYDTERRIFTECKAYCDAEKEFKQQIADLEAKLAEKECEIKQLNNIILISQLQAPEEQRLKIIGSSCCQYNPKRDKISFAVEQLEKVKTNILSNITFGIESVGIMNSINNQIEELKKEMK